MMSNPLLGLYVRKQDWDAALKLAEDPNGTFSEETRAKFDEALYLPYAEWLARARQVCLRRLSEIIRHRRDSPHIYHAITHRFDEALEAYRKSGRGGPGARMMQQLTFNAFNAVVSGIAVQGRVVLLLVIGFGNSAASSPLKKTTYRK